MAETIFFIHGMWGGGWYWEKHRRFLEDRGFTCIATTLRHHDMDPRDTPDPGLGTTSLLDYAQDLEQEIETLGVKPVLIGHSMGGLLAQILGARGLARALVLMTPAPPAGSITALKPSVARSFFGIMTKWGFWKKPIRLSFKAATYSMLHLLNPEAQKATYDRLVYESGRAAFEIGFWFLDAKGAARVDPAKVTCPVLVIAGGQDRITPASIIRQVAKRHGSAATYKEFENHAHWVVAEPGWQEIAECSAEWISGLSI